MSKHLPRVFMPAVTRQAPVWPILLVVLAMAIHLLAIGFSAGFIVGRMWKI